MIEKLRKCRYIFVMKLFLWWKKKGAKWVTGKAWINDILWIKKGSARVKVWLEMYEIKGMDLELEEIYGEKRNGVKWKIFKSCSEDILWIKKASARIIVWLKKREICWGYWWWIYVWSGKRK